MEGMIVPAVVISKVPWIDARSAAEVAAVANTPPLAGTSDAVPEVAVVPPTATVPREPKSCIDILPKMAEPAPFRSNFAEPLVVDIEVISSEQVKRYVPTASDRAPLVDQLKSLCAVVTELSV